MIPSGAACAITITRPSTSGVGEDRPHDRRLGDHQLALLGAKSTNSSGRLPSVDCSIPVTPPKRSPSCPVANDTTHARPASASVASRKRGTALQCW
jgi:hypothetical protein